MLKNLWHDVDELMNSVELLFVKSCHKNQALSSCQTPSLITMVALRMNRYDIDLFYNGASSFKPLNGKRQKLQVPFKEGPHVKMLVML